MYSVSILPLFSSDGLGRGERNLMQEPDESPQPHASAHLTDREIEELSQSAPRARSGEPPVLGRIGFFTVLACWAAFFFLGSLLDGGGRWVGLASYPLGLALAVASLLRKERRRFAITTIVLLAASPVLLFLIVTIVWMSYGAGIGR